MIEKIQPLKWKVSHLELLDQRYLPLEENVVKITTVEECYDAIKDMIVRGAPLIGSTGAYGAVLSIINNGDFEKDIKLLESARPTAVNLSYELHKCLEIYRNSHTEERLGKILEYADFQYKKLEEHNYKMAEIAISELDKTLSKKQYNMMTICNTGYLACGEIGTALGVISVAHKKNKLIKAYPTETRPYLQGSRLTCYELSKEEIPFDLIVEGAFSYVLENKDIDAIFVGADRIAKNGDTANKVGTSTLSIVAKHFGVPFYVVAPTSSFDLESETGNDIEIEMRDESEVTAIFGKQISPLGTRALNPSFDITRNDQITGIICENGIIKNFDDGSLSEIVNGK